MRILDPKWLPNVPMKGIILHWTAGNSSPSSVDKKHYHFLVDAKGAPHRAVDIAKNSGTLKSGYAAHTLNCNTGYIGLSLCGMMGAVENPFNPGPAPLTKVQWNAAILVAADLCEFYKIAVAKDKVLSHAEVQGALGIAQRGKWDITRLPFDFSLKGAAAVGNKFRAEVLAAMQGITPEPGAEPLPAGAEGLAIGQVTASSLKFRRGPGTSHEATGSLPEGTLVTVLSQDGDWYNVRSPAGYVGWVHGGYVKMLGDVLPEMPTQPDTIRHQISQLRMLLDQIEENLPGDRAALEKAVSDSIRTFTDLRN